MNYFVPEGQNYIILESLNSIKENQYPLSIHVLMFIEDNEHYILGRGHESDVRISDISVSRSHAKICMRDKKFYLEDSGSKFGTLVLAKDDLEINANQQILQIGRTLISTAEFDFSKHLNKNLKEDYVGVGTGQVNVNDDPMSNYIICNRSNITDLNMNNLNDNLTNLNFINSLNFNQSLSKNNNNKDKQNNNIHHKFNKKNFEDDDDGDI
jgi:pSer/pThr/pTyr-binding forkhead associated (FHA) protein